MRFLQALLLACLVTTGQAIEITRAFDVRNASSIKAEDLDKQFTGILSNTGKSFKEAEEKYKVNALFLAAIAIFESANGTSTRARVKKNCFGLKGKDFKTIEECIDYTAMILASPDGYYYGRNKFTIEKIGKTYAPTWDNPGNKKWIPAVIAIMKKVEKSAKSVVE